jgi:hypothetical protein
MRGNCSTNRLSDAALAAVVLMPMGIRRSLCLVAAFWLLQQQAESFLVA